MLTMSLQCVFIALGLKRCRSDIGCFWLPLVALEHEFIWLLVSALDACWVASSLGRSGPFQQLLLNQIWDLVLRRSYKDKLFKVRKIWKKMLTMSLQCVFIALGLKRCRSDIGCFWLPLVALEHEFIWLLVSALDACWVASSLGRSGPFQQLLLNQIWDLVLRRSYKDKLFKVRKIWKKMLTMSLQCVFIALGLKRCRSDIGCFWLPLVALEHEFIWLLVSALDACWVASSLGRSGPFQQCKKGGWAKSAALESNLRLGVTALP